MTRPCWRWLKQAARFGGTGRLSGPAAAWSRGGTNPALPAGSRMQGSWLGCTDQPENFLASDLQITAAAGKGHRRSTMWRDPRARWSSSARAEATPRWRNATAGHRAASPPTPSVADCPDRALCSTLRRGQTVLLDRLRVHKGERGSAREDEAKRLPAGSFAALRSAKSQSHRRNVLVLRTQNVMHRQTARCMRFAVRRRQGVHHDHRPYRRRLLQSLWLPSQGSTTLRIAVAAEFLL